MTFSTTFPLRTWSTLNMREHWAARARKTKAARRTVHLLWPWRASDETWDFPLAVTLTRISPSKGLDDDNLRGALKEVRDQVAAELGIDDGDKARVRWEYAEMRGPWGVGISIEELT